MLFVDFDLEMSGTGWRVGQKEGEVAGEWGWGVGRKG